MTRPEAGGRLPATDVAVVAIGRNEGERLVRCLNSVTGKVAKVVYVDSGSTDGSAGKARELGAIVVDLDMSKPFTAARARNAGFARIAEQSEGIRFVQFVDGDCEVADDWIETARTHLIANEDLAAVFGRRRERFPERTAFNRLCDLEWAVPPGPARSCGGDVMMRVDALQAVGGYRPTMIAGEEPELCVRLRQQGWKIECLAHPMTLHDADMTSLSQWWRRTMRAGHAYAEGYALHGSAPEYHNARETLRIWLWGAVLPVAVLALWLFGSPLWALLLLAYPVQVARLAWKRRNDTQWSLLLALSQVAGKIPEAVGQMKYIFDRLRGRGGRIIEYK